MVSKTITIPSYFHSSQRLVPQLVQIASAFQSTIYFRQSTRKANAKSMMGVMSLQFSAGTPFGIIAEGTDEQEAVNRLTQIFSEEEKA